MQPLLSLLRESGPLDSHGTTLRRVQKRAEAEFSGHGAPRGPAAAGPPGSLAQVGLCGFFGAVQARLPVAWAAERVLLWDVRMSLVSFSRKTCARTTSGFIAP